MATVVLGRRSLLLETRQIARNLEEGLKLTRLPVFFNEDWRVKISGKEATYIVHCWYPTEAYGDKAWCRVKISLNGKYAEYGFLPDYEPKPDSEAFLTEELMTLIESRLPSEPKPAA